MLYIPVHFVVNRELDRIFIHCCSYWIAEARRVQVGKKPQLWYALFQCFKWQLMFHGFLFAVEVHVQKIILMSTSVDIIRIYHITCMSLRKNVIH